MGIVKKIILETVSIYILTQLLSSVIIFKGLQTYILAGLVLWLLSVVLKPILKFIVAPFYLISLGAISILINAFLFFLLTLIVHGITVKDFMLNNFSASGFTIPRINFNLFETFIIVAMLELMIKWLLLWITD